VGAAGGREERAQARRRVWRADAAGLLRGAVVHCRCCAPEPTAWLGPCPPLPQAEAAAHDAHDFSDDEGPPPFKEQLAAAAKRGQGQRGGKQAATKRGRAR
jgi:hypothetical protein